MVLQTIIQFDAKMS